MASVSRTGGAENIRPRQRIERRGVPVERPVSRMKHVVRYTTTAWVLIACAGLSAAGERQNVLFIAVDDLKPALGCYGDPLAKTPAIDAVAARGTVFMNAECQWPVCGPSRASLLTSLRPEATGVMDLKTDVRARNPDVVTLPQYFRAHGYVTAGVGKIFDPRCVDNKKDLDKPSWSIPFVHAKAKLGNDNGSKQRPAAARVECADEDLTDGAIRVEGVRLLKQLAAGEQPFFLAVGFKKPHLPFVAPADHWGRHQRNALQPAEHQGGISGDSGYVLHDSKELRGYEGIPASGLIEEPLQKELLHGYYACVSYIDAQVGHLLEELKRAGLADKTVVVLWGDHGFHLGDHGMWGKHSTLEQAARVPLIVARPGGATVNRTDSPVELTDIFPTLCDLAGIELPKGVSGQSLVPILDGTTRDVRPAALTVFRNRGAMGYSIRTRCHRYTEWINKFGKVVARDLFDYEADPLETTNLIEHAGARDVAADMAQRLEQVARGCERFDSRQTARE